jgi:hypothetical protein
VLHDQTNITLDLFAMKRCDIIEYLLELLIQRQIGTHSMTLWTAINRIETNRILRSRNWQETFGNSSSKMFTAAMDIA